MKYLAIALIVVADLAADLGADLWLPAQKAHEWGVSSTIILLACAVAWPFGDD